MADQELAPEQLDALEDALEGLLADEPAPDNLSSAARERLDEYREVSDLVRRTLPDEEPAPDLVRRVLQAAGEELARTPAPTPRPSRARRGWRRLLVPTLALAGSAAAVLWWVRHEGGPGQIGEVRTVHEPGARAQAPAAPAPAPEGKVAEDAAAPEPRRAATPAPLEEESAPAAAKGEAAGRTQEQDERKLSGQGYGRGGGGVLGGLGQGRATSGAGSRGLLDEPKRKRRKARRTSAAKPAPLPPAESAGAGPADDAFPASEPAAPPAGAAADSASADKPSDRDAAPTLDWNTLADADRARRTGRCARASELYRALTGAGDRRLAARAHAGLGLCALARGRSGEAHFARARALDPGVSAFIDAERP